LLTGTSYWEPERRDADNIFSLIAAINEGAGEAATVRAARAGVELPPAFDAWFAKATAVRPEDRHPTASALAAELARALDVPIQSAPPDILGPRRPTSTGADVNTQGVTPSGVSVEAGRRPAGARLRVAMAALGIAAALALGGPPVVSYLRGGRIEAPAQPAAIAAQEVGAAPSNRAALEPSADPAAIPAAPADPMAASADGPGAPPSPPPSRSDRAALEPGAGPRAIPPVAERLAAPAARSGAPAEPLPRDSTNGGSQRAGRPFDRVAAAQAVQQKATIASTLCRGRGGPKVVATTLIFKRPGVVARVEVDIRVRNSAAGVCAIGVLQSTTIPDFDGEAQPMPAAVILE
jgi:serine/threonine-protein kinase